MGLDIAPRSIFGKPEMPDLSAFVPETGPRCRATDGPSAPGADGVDDGNGGANATFDVEIGIIQDVGVRGRLQRRGGAIAVAFVALEDALRAAW